VLEGSTAGAAREVPHTRLSADERPPRSTATSAAAGSFALLEAHPDIRHQGHASQ